MSSTVRFAKVVEVAGSPVLHVLWGPLGSDAEFQKAIQAQRVMTIRQENVGSKKDFGLIGFSQEARAQFLIFPRSLKPFQGRRVVGINYEIFDPPPKPAASSKTRDKSEDRPIRRTLAEPKPGPIASKRVTAERPSPAEKESKKRKETVSVEPAARPGKRLHLLDTPVPETTRAAQPTAGEWDRRAVLKEVKSAMKELEAGKAVLVFRRLDKLAKHLKENG